MYLWIDGRKWDGVLRYGKVFTSEIPPGRHLIRANNTLFSHQVEFDAAPGETVRFRADNGLTPGGIVMVLMLGVAYLRVRLVRLPA